MLYQGECPLYDNSLNSKSRKASMQHIMHYIHLILARDTIIGIYYCETARLEIHRYTTEI